MDNKNGKLTAGAIIAPMFLTLAGCHEGNEHHHDDHHTPAPPHTPYYPALHDGHGGYVSDSDYLYVVDTIEEGYSHSDHFSKHLQDYISHGGFYDYSHDYYITRDQYGYSDEAHSLVMTEHTYYGAVSGSTIYEFDYDGHLTFESIDWNGDHYSDYTSTWDYNPYTFQITQYEDFNGDGYIDLSTSFTGYTAYAQGVNKVETTQKSLESTNDSVMRQPSTDSASVTGMSAEKTILDKEAFFQGVGHYVNRPDISQAPEAVEYEAPAAN